MGTYAQNKRWRLSHPEGRNKDRESYYGRTTGSANSGKEWTDAEDELVLAHEVPDRVLAGQLERSVRSIQIRRSRIRPR